MSKVLAEGKTKRIHADPDNPELVLVESKDDITAGDGARRDTIAGKAALATLTTINCFELLERRGIPTHYRGRVVGSDVVFRAAQLDMIPIELVTRRVAFGSYLKRNPDTPEQTVFKDPTFEMFAKDDPNHDPLLEYDFRNHTVSRYDPTQSVGEASLLDRVGRHESTFDVSEGQLAVLRSLAVRTFCAVEEAWAGLGVTLVDMKVECGKTSSGQIVVGDVIDNDSWRIWPGGDPDNMVDKQLYRDGMPLSYVADRYAWVAEATNQFAA